MKSENSICSPEWYWRWQLSDWSIACRNWSCHKSTRLSKEFPDLRQQDGETANWGRIQSIHKREERHWHCIDKSTCKGNNKSQRAVLIVVQIAEKIRDTVDKFTDAFPAVLEIPSKDHPYDPEKDSVLRRVRKLFGEWTWSCHSLSPYQLPHSCFESCSSDSISSAFHVTAPQQ